VLKKTVVTCVVLAALFPAAAMAEEPAASLADRLPVAKTAVWAELDLKDGFDQAARTLRFVDADAGEKVIARTQALWELLKEIAANYEFQPAILERPSDLRLYLLVLARDEPKKSQATRQVPRFDVDKGEVSYEEQTYSVVDEYVLSLVVEAPQEAAAADLIEQVKALLDRMAESHPGSDEFAREDVDVEMGQMVRLPAAGVTLGQLGNYVILSDDEPQELWRALMASPEQSVSQTPMYRRIIEGQRMPQTFVLVNVPLLAKRTGEGLKRSLDEATARQAAQSGAEGESWEIGFEVSMARWQYTLFQVVRTFLSLDRCRFAGFSFYTAVDDGRAVTESKGFLSHDERIGACLKELLDGSGSFAVPPVAVEEAVAMMTRVSPVKVYDELIKALSATDPAMAASFQMGTQMVAQTLGTDIRSILDLFAPDAYFFVTVEPTKTSVVTDWKENEAGDWEPVEEEKTVVMPHVTVLWGLKDAAEASKSLNAIFSAAGANPQLAGTVRKRTYQGTDVFCLGSSVDQPDAYPDGVTSFALTVVGRYLTFGSWDRVTDAIRRLKAGTGGAPAELQEAVAKNPGANLIVVVPKAFQDRLRELQKAGAEQEGKMMDLVLEQLQKEDFGLTGDLAVRFKDAVTKLISAVQEFQQKAEAAQTQTGVVVGVHRGNVYEIHSVSEVHK